MSATGQTAKWQGGIAMSACHLAPDMWMEPRWGREAWFKLQQWSFETMRYELTDRAWNAIRPMLPNKPRGVPRVDDRRVLNGIFWVLRSGAPWRDLPKSYGPPTTCYNRFVRWRRAGVWAKLRSALPAPMMPPCK